MPEDYGYPSSGKPSRSKADKSVFDKPKEIIKGSVDKLKKRWESGVGITNQGTKKQLDELEKKK